jgi:hypothetical protein
LELIEIAWIKKERVVTDWKAATSELSVEEVKGWGYSSVVEYFLSRYKALASIPSTEKKKKYISCCTPESISAPVPPDFQS